MKIAVFTDVHANLPALRAVLDALAEERCDVLVHLGDAIAIGPHPAECLELILGLENVRFVMGNHDAYFAFGLPQLRPAWMSEGEVEHQLWTHAQIDPALRSTVAEWPVRLTLDLNGTGAAFVHYALDASGRKFATIMRNPTATDLDAAFSVYEPDGSPLVFYGHAHEFSDIQGQARYVNPGAVGCARGPLARYTVVTSRQGAVRVEHRVARYDDAELFAAFEDRDVPERGFIYRAFFGGRFG